jgi:hypothetical protein
MGDLTGHILAPMPDEAAMPEDELSRSIKNAIAAGAATGAEETARRMPRPPPPRWTR